MIESIWVSLLDIIPTAILVIDSQKQVVICNAAAEEYFDTKKQKIVNSPLATLLPYSHLLDEADKLLNYGGSKAIELKEGGMDTGLITKVVLSVPEVFHEIGFCLLRLEDVTETSRLEAKLVRVEKRGEELRLLVRSIAHELGNPLTVMRSTLQYIQELKLSLQVEIKQPLLVVNDCIEQMHTLLQSITDFVMTKKARFKPVDIRYLVPKVLNLYEQQASQQGMKIVYDIEEEIPIFQGDAGTLRALLANLVKNALEALSSGGQVTINVSVNYRCDGSPELLRLKVHDTGPGIASGNIDEIFKPFYSTKLQGHGLGLAFCQRMVTEYGGDIQVESNQGKGCTFIVLLPYEFMEINYGSKSST